MSPKDFIGMPILERIFFGVRFEPTGCWIYRGTKRRNGYFTIWDNDRRCRRKIAIVVAEHFLGDPTGRVVLHLCDTPACINPNHLMLGTQSDNVRDCVAKNRHYNASRTHCKKGHSLENCYLRKDGRRYCRECALIGRRESRRNTRERELNETLKRARR